MCSQNVLWMNHCCPLEQGILKLLSGVQFRDTSWSKNWRGDRTSQNHPLGLCGVLNERPTRKEPPATHWVRPLQKIIRKPWTKMQRQQRIVLSIAPAGTGFIKLEKIVRSRKILKRPALHQAPVPQQTLAKKLIQKAKGAMKRKNIGESPAQELEKRSRKRQREGDTATGRNEPGAEDNADATQQPEDTKMNDGESPAYYVQPRLSVDEVLSAAGGMTDRCAHVENGVRCSGEAHAVCPNCWVVLCSTHFDGSNVSCCHEHNPLIFCPCMLCQLGRL